MKIDIQFSAATNSWPRLRAAVLRAEADGYDSTWVFDHFDGALLGGNRPMLECFALLGALAEATATSGLGTIGLGTLVANVANRHPAVLASSASTLQRLSRGRLRLGLGAGTSPASTWSSEHLVRGIPLKADIGDRHAAVEEQIRHVRALPESIPIIVGVNSVRLATIAGRLADGVNVRLSHERCAEFVEVARSAAAGRPFEVSAWTASEPDDVAGEVAGLAIDRLIVTRLGSLR